MIQFLGQLPDRYTAFIGAVERNAVLIGELGDAPGQEVVPLPPPPRAKTAATGRCRQESGRHGDSLVWQLARGSVGGGVDVGKPLKPHRQWMEQQVIEELQTLHRRGMRLVNLRKTDNGLVCAAKRYFGSWFDALVAAGLAAETARPPCKQKWSRHRILDVCYNNAAGYFGFDVSATCA